MIAIIRGEYYNVGYTSSCRITAFDNNRQELGSIPMYLGPNSFHDGFVTFHIRYDTEKFNIKVTDIVFEVYDLEDKKIPFSIKNITILNDN